MHAARRWTSGRATRARRASRRIHARSMTSMAARARSAASRRVCAISMAAVSTLCWGEEDYYGLGSEVKVDTSKPMTVTTQFISANGKNNGHLKEIRRNYIQDGVVVKNAVVTVDEEEYDSISPAYCHATDGSPYFFPNGGLRRMGQALARGMVLTFCKFY